MMEIFMIKTHSIKKKTDHVTKHSTVIPKSDSINSFVSNIMSNEYFCNEYNIMSKGKSTPIFVKILLSPLRLVYGHN